MTKIRQKKEQPPRQNKAGSIGGRRNIISIVNTEHDTPITSSGHFNSAFSLAAAEKHYGDKVSVWAKVPKEPHQVYSLGARYGVTAHTVNKYTILIRLLTFKILPRLRTNKYIRVHSGTSMVSRKAATLKKFSGTSHLLWFLHGPHQTRADFFDNRELIDEHLKNCAFVDSVAVPSEAEKDAHLQIGVPDSKIHVVPNIVHLHQAGKLPPAILNLAPEKKLLLFGARLQPEKGLKELLEAFAIVVKHHMNLILAVAGEGNELEKCRRLAADIPGIVHFLGTQENLTALLQRANIFIAPSKAESFGRTAVEAAMSETPMVISRIRPWTDYFDDGKHCLYCNPGDSNDIAHKVKSLLKDVTLAKTLAYNAKKHTESIFGVNATLSALHQLYKEYES